jgi:HEAT repeat protein
VPGLVARLDDPEPSARVEAAAGLAAIGPVALDAVPRLLRQAKDDPNQDARATAASALVRIDADAAAPLVVEYARVLAATGLQERRGAAVVLGSLGAIAKPAVPALVAALGDDDALLRNRAAGALGSIGLPAELVVPALAGALEDRDPIVRQAASAAFAFSLAPDASRAAEAVLRHAAAGADRHTAELARIGLANAERTRGDADVRVLLIVLDTESARAHTLQQLAETGPRAHAAVPALVRALADGPTLHRYLAAEALGAIGPAAREGDAVPALRVALTDPAAVVRESARAALARIGAAA